MDLLKVAEDYYKPLSIELPGHPAWIAWQINSRRGIEFSMTVGDSEDAEMVARRFLAAMIRIRPDGNIRLKTLEEAAALDPTQIEALDRQGLSEAVGQYLSASADRLDSALTSTDDRLGALKAAFISLRNKQYGRGPGYTLPDTARLDQMFGRGFSHSLRALQLQTDLLRHQPKRNVGVPPFRFRYDDDEGDHSAPDDPPADEHDPLIDALEEIRTIQQRQVELQASAADLMSQMLVTSTGNADAASKYARGALIVAAASLVVTIILGALSFVGSHDAANQAAVAERAAQIERQRMVTAIEGLASQAAAADANEASRHTQSLAQHKALADALLHTIEQQPAGKNQSQGKNNNQQHTP